MDTKKSLCIALISVLFLTGMITAVSCGSSSSTTTAATTTPGGAQTSPPGQTTGPDFTPAEVSIENLTFVPASLTVRPGTTVTWTNNDSTIHTVISDTGVFESQTLGLGAIFSFTFTENGVYPYHCSIHPEMKGIINVQ